MKKAENSDEYVVRVYEIGGEKVQDAVLSFAGEIASAAKRMALKRVSVRPNSVETGCL